MPFLPRAIKGNKHSEETKRKAIESRKEVKEEQDKLRSIMEIEKIKLRRINYA
jgi:hypothetical protein